MLDKIHEKIQIGIRHIGYCVILVIVFMCAVSFVDPDTTGEAYTGDFGTTVLDGWEVSLNGQAADATLPCELKTAKDDEIILRNTLPETVTEKQTLIYDKTNLNDIYVYIDGELRNKYASEDLRYSAYYTPSAYIITDLEAEDAGKVVEVHLIAKDNGKLGVFRLADGNNFWYGVIENNLFIIAVALFMTSIGFITLAVFLIFRKKLHLTRAVMYLSLLLVAMGIWMISESELRQLFMRRPSVIGIYTYLAIGVAGVLILLYFDTVQRKRFHKRYLLGEGLITLQLLTNIVMSVSGIMDFHKSLIFIHMWMLTGIIMVLASVFEDVVSRKYREYKSIAVGMVLFIVLCGAELISFYNGRHIALGSFISIGLMILLGATIIQVAIDEEDHVRERDRNRETTMVNTIETIASSIDAKDEYTGGHSERVGEYAGILAREMAADYDLTEEDILRIRYIGLMHDIGKIGVADTILNKAGRLTDEEFNLMKKHVIIGSELLGSMTSTEGLVEGIRYHHERFDGRGYPDGLKGTEIPLIARILCLADCYDAMTSNRVYRRRLSDEEVRNEIVKCAGSQFDPALAEIFVRLIDRGALRPATVSGMETDETGRVLTSSAIEYTMQRYEASEDNDIVNPSHVRMLCYIVKLAEKKKMRVDVFFADTDIAYGKERLSDALKKCLRKHDISMEFTEDKTIIALFDYNDEDMSQKVEMISNQSGCKVYPLELPE